MTPTPIQAHTHPELLDGEELIGQARTGSGKMLAFMRQGSARGGHYGLRVRRVAAGAA